MTELTKTDIETTLKTIIDPNHGLDLVSAKSVKAISVENNNVNVKIELGYPALSYHAELKSIVEQHLKTLAGIGKLNVEVGSKIISHAVQQALKPQPNIKNIIAVASGKGGVGIGGGRRKRGHIGCRHLRPQHSDHAWLIWLS
jgi:ATP-binding protein involved in chromosome partitioning